HKYRIREKAQSFRRRLRDHASTSSNQTQFETRSLPALSRSYPPHFASPARTFHVAHPVCSIQRIGQLRKHSREMCGLKVFDYFGGDDVWIFSAFQFFRNGFRLFAKK